MGKVQSGTTVLRLLEVKKLFLTAIGEAYEASYTRSNPTCLELVGPRQPILLCSALYPEALSYLHTSSHNQVVGEKSI